MLFSYVLMHKYIIILIVDFTYIKSCLSRVRNQRLSKKIFLNQKKPNILLITLAFKTIDHIELIVN